MHARFLFLALLCGCDGSIPTRSTPPSIVVGCYSGRGGFSTIELTLSDNDRYVADYYFDIGHGGYSFGTWSIQRGKLMLVPRHADSILSKLEGAFPIIKKGSRVSLVIPGGEESDLASFSPLEPHPCEL
jgi:hypothetical protein